jgi:hypothetical protein
VGLWPTIEVAGAAVGTVAVRRGGGGAASAVGGQRVGSERVGYQSQTRRRRAATCPTLILTTKGHVAAARSHDDAMGHALG